MAEKEGLVYASRKRFTCDEKGRVSLKVQEYYEDYKKEVEAAKTRVNYNNRRKKHTTVLPKQGYIAKAVREMYTNFQDVKNTDPALSAAVKNAIRWYEDLVAGKLDDSGVQKTRFRVEGGGRKTKAPEVCHALFEWFVDVRTVLKARLPRKLFVQKANQLYEDWLKQHPDTPEEDHLLFSKHWIQDWEKEFGVSLSQIKGTQFL